MASGVHGGLLSLIVARCILVFLTRCELPMLCQQKRYIGLTIGNSAYPGAAGDTALPRLPHPARDAAAMHAVLSKTGFHMLTTTPVLNSTRAAMQQLIQALTDAVHSGDTVVVHFSGHGFAAEAGFYLVPVDAGVWGAAGCGMCVPHLRQPSPALVVRIEDMSARWCLLVSAGTSNMLEDCVQLHRIMKKLFSVMERGTVLFLLDACRTVYRRAVPADARPMDPSRVSYGEGYVTVRWGFLLPDRAHPVL